MNTGVLALWSLRATVFEQSGDVSHVLAWWVGWNRVTRRRRMGLIGRFKKFPLPQALVLQYSLNQWKIAGVQSDPLQHATSRPDCFTIPTYLLYGAFSFMEANRFSTSKEIPRILCNPNVHYHIHYPLSLTCATSIQSMLPHPRF
jgi:hypothetical protein